uniref:amidohydrolase family protein n=1 Tax=Paenarthrobacter ureafaciens TaxID=37931 RepID=UPI003F491A6F
MSFTQSSQALDLWPIVDAHVHVGIDKYRPVEAFWNDAEACGVDVAVLVQYMGHYDNSYISACVRKAPDRFVGIAMVDVNSPKVLKAVESVAQDGAFAGIRLEARTRSGGEDPYQIWRAIAESGLVASVRGPLEDILHPSFQELLEELPELTIRLEHSAFFRFQRHTGTQFEQILGMSERAQTYLMWSGYYDFSEEPYPYKDAYPFLQESLAAFGARRIMWSGDWNRNDLDAERPQGYYLKAVGHIHDELDFVNESDLAQIMGQSALRYLAASRVLSKTNLPSGVCP